MNANANPPIYVLFKDIVGAVPFFKLLADREAYERTISNGKVLNRTVSQLHTRGPKPDDPPIEIVCITYYLFGEEVAHAVSQRAMDWLMETCVLKMKE